jgi:hypothetical protein
VNSPIDHHRVDAARAMRLVGNVYGVDYLSCRERHSSKIAGYDHAAHGHAPRTGGAGLHGS